MRRNRAEHRTVTPDPRYNSEVVAKFINNVMERGKKSLAARIVYDAFDLMEERTKRPAIEVFEEGLKNATPLVEVRPRRVGGATYQIPMEISASRRMALAMRWLIDNARKRSGRDMAVRLAGELMDSARNEGASVKKREDTHRMAEANQAFAHFRI
ncbi:MAG: 30S ribosomal protein S7 [Caldilineaceae bacterium]|nr:30S ribosomal protein S7 [Caldilineaceae bacterium]MCB0096544.1 30S ribosomal protein S7 [Caldilineaceae bacterium]MCB0140967.1 30S ribosomal protein S7 [Caldilineaceae bacterium]MCB9147630.1 30S ribosomal protein S7 [Caldilineaceae bacterium]MCB9157317.1 30S ribosomal protein S7 [Caldilineaceae bacterium]